MTVDRTIGIDLGTTNSVAAYTDTDSATEVIAGKDGDRIVPSVVYFEKGAAPVVGARARQYALVEPERVASLFKRGMGEAVFLPDGSDFSVDGRIWKPEELSSLVLKKLKAMAEERFGEPVTKAVITVPAYFGEPERVATRTAGDLAGLEVVRILNEPTAAALAHGLDHAEESGRVLVFDLGGGTFDVTVMDIEPDGSLSMVATGGDRQLGGADFDRLIVERMATVARQSNGADLLADPWTAQDAYAKAEETKKELSTAESSTRPVTAGGRPVMVSLTRAELEKLIARQIQSVEDMVLHTLEEAGVEPSELTRVLMVGGSSRLPVFRELLVRVTGQEPIFSRNLDEDVARGAAILAAKLTGDLDPRSQLARMPVPADIASHGLGITILADGPGRGDVNSIVIPAGVRVPAEGSGTFYTVYDGQTQVKITVNEGEEEDLDYVRALGETVGRFARPVGRDHPIRVDVRYTEDQIITMSAYDGESGAFLCDLELKREGIMSKADKNAARDQLAALNVR